MCGIDVQYCTVVLNLTHFCLFQTKENPTFKDNDFTKDNAKLRIGDDVKKDLLQRVKDDVEVSLFVIKIVNIVIKLYRRHVLHQTKHAVCICFFSDAHSLGFQDNFSTRCYSKNNNQTLVFFFMQFLTSLNIMDYSLLVGIHDAEAGNDVDDVLEGIDSNEDSEPESPREADSPQESDSPGEAEMPLSETPPTTPPADLNGPRERNISFGSNELDEREDDDDTEGFQSVDGRLLLVKNK